MCSRRAIFVKDLSFGLSLEGWRLFRQTSAEWIDELVVRCHWISRTGIKFRLLLPHLLRTPGDEKGLDLATGLVRHLKLENVVQGIL